MREQGDTPARGRRATGTARRSVLAVAALWWMTGCSSDPATPRGRAELFLDAYYVLIDLQAALEHTAGVAHAKVEQSVELTKGQIIDESTNRPRVRYQLVEEHPDGTTAANLVFLADITADGDTSQRKWMVTVRQQPEGWRVTNFQEFAAGGVTAPGS